MMTMWGVAGGGVSVDVWAGVADGVAVDSVGEGDAVVVATDGEAHETSRAATNRNG